MKVRIVPVIAACLLAAGAVAAQTPEERTKQALDFLLSGKTDAFYALLAPEAQARIPAAALAEQFRPVVALGEPMRREAPVARAAGHRVTVVIRIEWAIGIREFVAVWSDTGSLLGATVRPPPAPAWQRPEYSDPAKFTEATVSIGDDRCKLPGTLLVPKGDGPFPAVVLVGGSGAPNRDEAAGAAKVFRDIAEGLASRGIAVLRYDSRKLVCARGEEDADFTLTREKVEDALRATALVRRSPGVDPARVFVLGHSLGAYAIPRIMAADPKLAGAIAMAGNSRPFGEVLRDQKEYEVSLNPAPSAADRAALEELRRNPASATATWGAAYVADLNGYDPVAVARASAMPLLVLQGERDFQVTMRDFAGWKAGLAGRKGATLKSYPKLNHLFLAGEGKGRPAEYDVPGHVAAEVIADVAVWVLGSKTPDGTNDAK